MNSTKWLTLTEFVKHLGRTGQCKVEETEKGWFITLVHRDEMEVSAAGTASGGADALAALAAPWRLAPWPDPRACPGCFAGD